LAGVEKNSSRNLSMGKLFISSNVQLFMLQQHRRPVIPSKGKRGKASADLFG
jgi:hypothetical protein